MLRVSVWINNATRSLPSHRDPEQQLSARVASRGASGGRGKWWTRRMAHKLAGLVSVSTREFIQPKHFLPHVKSNLVG